MDMCSQHRLEGSTFPRWTLKALAIKELLFYSSRNKHLKRLPVIYETKSIFKISVHAVCPTWLSFPITHSGTHAVSLWCRWRPATVDHCREVHSARSGRQLCCVCTHTCHGPVGQTPQTENYFEFYLQVPLNCLCYVLSRSSRILPEEKHCNILYFILLCIHSP